MKKRNKMGFMLCVLLLFAALVILFVGRGPQTNVTDTDPEDDTTADTQTEENDTNRIEVPKTDDGLLIHFFHAPVEGKKWGDCTYLEFADGTNMLVDIGLAPAGKQVAEELSRRGVTSLDIVILTHFHADHVNGLKHLLDRFEIRQIYSPGYIAEQFAWVEEEIENRSIPYERLVAGDTVSFGESEIHVLWPLAELVEEDPTLPASSSQCVTDTNNRSMVFRLEYQGVSILFTADVYKQAQNDILSYYADDLSVLDVDVLKVPHHGYENAVNENFIAACSPEYAVMMGDHIMPSVYYGYYTQAGCTTYATWMNGHIYVVVEQGSYDIFADSLQINEYYH